MKKTMDKKAASAVSVIGGADGPTSIFLVGSGRRERNIFKRFRMWRQSKKYQKKRERAGRRIVPNSHTMEELIRYVAERYGAVEADAAYPYYEERKNGMKYCRIQREKPELLGERKQLLPPENLTDKEALTAWYKELEAWDKESMEKAAAVPFEVFPTAYHMYVIDRKEEGRLELEIDSYCPGISMSYSGRAMKEIARDIHWYYGVTRQDIEEKSERYLSLLTELST